MAVSNIYIYCGEGGWSVDDVNRLTDSLSIARVWESHDGISLTSLTVLTEEDESLFYKQATISPLRKEYNGFWNIANCFQQGFLDNHAEDKILILPQPTVGLDLIGIPILEGVPERGSLENAPKGSTEEDKELVKMEQLYPIQQWDNWWNDETDMSPNWIGMAASTGRFFYKEITDNLDTIYEDYDPTNYGLQQFIECELEPQLFWLNHPHGINAPYHIGHTETQLERNDIWEAVVRPHFQNTDDGYGWRGLGGDEESLAFEQDHEYRTLSRQISFVTFEGDTSEAEKDEYCRWWILP
tara:strand:+ start:467 stop:1360 length:894 start_codon:yes stop_codon:yes gene_type:complete